MEEQKPTIPFNIFTQLDLRIGTITMAEAIESADKLLRLEVDIGEEKRQLVAGIRSAYAPDELVGKQIVVVANLEPRVLKGVESQGMLLCADGAEGPVLLAPERDVPTGAIIK